MARDVRDWVRERATVESIDMPAGGAPTVTREPRRASALEEVEERLRLEDDAALAEDAREELATRREEAQLRRQARIATYKRQIDGATTGDKSDSEVVKLLGTLISQGQTMQQTFLEEVRELRKNQEDIKVTRLQGEIQRMQDRLTELATRSTTEGGGERTSLMKTIIDEFKLLGEVRKTIEQESGTERNAPAIDPGWSRQQVLDRIQLDYEVEIRLAELADRREEREFKKVQARDAAQLKRDRMERAFSGLEPLAETLSSILGGRARTLMEARPQGAGQAAPPNGNGVALRDWQCPGCQRINQSPPGTDIAACAGCHEVWHPFGGGETHEEAPADQGAPDPDGYVDV